MVGIFRYLFHRYRIEAELLDYELDFPTIRKKRKKILKNKLENYLKIPVIKAEPEDLLRGLPNPTNDIDILFIPDYIGKNKLNKKLLSKFPIQLFQDLEEEDLSNKEIFLIEYFQKSDFLIFRNRNLSTLCIILMLLFLHHGSML